MNGAGAASEENVSMDKLINDFKAVMRDGEALIKGSAGDLGEKAREARARLDASLAAAKRNFHRAEARAWEGARVTDEVIREHPYESVGIAFGVGLLLGVLITR